MMQANDFKGLYGTTPTRAKPGRERLTATDTVDLAETERLVGALIADGCGGLIALGTTGECATLSDADFKAFTSCVVDTVRGRIPAFLGATAMGGHETARRLAHVADIGAEGSLLGLPMWQPLTTRMAIDFFTEVSAAFPELAIMAYANARAFRFAFSVEFWAAISKTAPTVTSAKVSRPVGLLEQITATGGRINFMPSDMVAGAFYHLSPDTTPAAWATAAGMDPAPSVALVKAITKRDDLMRDALVAAIAWANEPIHSLVSNPDLFASYNIQMEKTRINAAGYSKAGPVRSPYDDFPDDLAAEARLCASRWVTICAALKAGTITHKPWLEVAA